MLKSIVKKDNKPKDKNHPIESLSKLLDNKLAKEKYSQEVYEKEISELTNKLKIMESKMQEG